MLVSVQPATGSSVIVNVPGAKSTNTCEFVGLALPGSSSNVKGVKPDPDTVYVKSCSSSGTPSLITVMLAPLVFVNVTVMASPGSTSIVAVRLARSTLLPLSGSETTRSVKRQPDNAASVIT